MEELVFEVCAQDVQGGSDRADGQGRPRAEQNRDADVGQDGTYVAGMADDAVGSGLGHAVAAVQLDADALGEERVRGHSPEEDGEAGQHHCQPRQVNAERDRPGPPEADIKPRDDPAKDREYTGAQPGHQLVPSRDAPVPEPFLALGEESRVAREEDEKMRSHDQNDSRDKDPAPEPVDPSGRGEDDGAVKDDSDGRLDAPADDSPTLLPGHGWARISVRFSGRI